MTDDTGRAARAQTLRENALAQYETIYDAERGMVTSVTDTGTYYPTRESLKYARLLLLRDAAGDAARADGLIRAVLATQEREPGNPHEGNFPWMADDGHITDLNAVEFCLEELVGICRETPHLLPADTVTAMHAAMHRAFAEVARLAVHVSYSNIALHEIQNTILGGQVLHTPEITARGARKLRDWAAYTAAGAPREFNSPTYQAIDLTALANVAEYADDPATRLLARLWEERLWLATALRYHPATGQVAGPHSRAYHPDVMGGRGGLKTAMWKELGDDALARVSPYFDRAQGGGSVDIAEAPYHLPDGVRALFDGKPLPMTVTEGAGEYDLITHLTENWTLGTASAEYGPQANNLILHYARGDAGSGEFGVLFTRFILNKKRLGSTYHATDRSHSRNLVDDGQFRGFQHEHIAIGCYGLPPTGEITAAALDTFIAGAERVEGVLIGDTRVTQFPAEVPPGSPVVVADGAVYIGLRPLRHTRMGRETPVRLEIRDGDLVLSQVLYDGPPKGFWEYRTLAGPFYRGNVESGVVVHVADRAAYPSAEAFAAALATATVEDATTDGVRAIRYACAGQDVRFRYRLYDPAATETRLPVRLATIERWANGAAFVPQPLASPVAAATHGAHAPTHVDDIALRTDHDGWLYRSPADGSYTFTSAIGTGNDFACTFPFGGSIRALASGAGLASVTVAADGSSVTANYAGEPGALLLVHWPALRMATVNGQEIAVRETRLAHTIPLQE